MAFEDRKATGRPFVAALATVVLISSATQAAAPDDEPLPSGDGSYGSRLTSVPQLTVEARRELQRSVNSFGPNLTHYGAPAPGGSS